MRPVKVIVLIGGWILLLLFSLYQEGKAPEKIYWKSFIQKELPGPQDIWAGSQFHEIRIIKPLPQAKALLRLHIRDAHSQYPPRLEISLNRLRVGEIQIRPGLGSTAEKEGLPGTYTLPIGTTPEILREPKEILIRNIRGSWVRIETVELTSMKKVFSFDALYSPELSGYQSYLFWLSALGLCWGLLWVHRSPPLYSLIAIGYTSLIVFFNLYSNHFPGLWGPASFTHTPKGIKILAAYLLQGFFIFSFPSGFRLKTWHKSLALSIIPFLFFLIRSYNDPPDGAQWVRFVPEGVFYPREPLATYIQHLFYMAIKPVLSNPREALAVLSLLLGIPGTYFLWKWAKSIFETPAEQFFFTLSILASFGFAGLFLGHIETYPILVVALCGYLWSATLYFKNLGHPKWPTLWLSLAFNIHLATIWLIPAHIYLLMTRLRCPSSHRWKILGEVIFYALLPVILLSGLMFLHGSPLTSWVKDFGNIFPGSASPFYSWKELISPRHLKDVFNEHVYLAPSLLLLLLFVRIKTAEAPLRLFLLMAFISFEFYTFSFKPGLGAQRDWDLFSPLTPIALGFLWFSQKKTPYFKLFIIPMIGLSLFQTMPMAWRNHQSTNFVLVKESSKPDIIIPKDWILLDTLDVGNPQHEFKHQYQIKKEARSPLPSFGTVPEKEIKCAGDQAFLWDKGRAHEGAESFSVKALVGTPLFIVKRIHGDVENQSVNVLVNGKMVGLWKIPGRAKNSFRGSLFMIPASFIQSPETRLTFESLSPNQPVTSYYYWIYTPRKVPTSG